MRPDPPHTPDPRPDELLPTRESLLSRLKDWEDQDGWRLDHFRRMRNALRSLG